MKFRLGAVGVLAVTLALGNVPDVVKPAAVVLEPGPRVMVVGDSVAHQFDGDYTWRYRLAMEFQRQHAPVNFVGPFAWGYGEAHHYLAQGWDSDHDAQGATVIKNFMDLEPVPGAPEWGRHNIVATMQEYQPDVLVSVLANNDVNNALAGTRYGIPSIRDGLRYFGKAWAEPRVDQLIRDVLADYQAFVASARSVKPDIKIVIAEITSQLIPPWIRDQVNGAFTSEITSTASSPVVVAPTDDERWSRPGFTVDGIHTTPTGDLLMAQRIALGVHALPGTPLPGRPAIPQRTIPWDPALVPRVVVAGPRIYLSWRASASANTALGMRVRLVRVATGETSTGAFRRKPGWTSSTLEPGVYRVQIQGIRKSMRSTWSPPHQVTVHVGRCDRTGCATGAGRR